VQGCLSFPKINGNVERSLRCKVKYQDSTGKKKTMQLEGWQARIFQHEYDHLEVRACAPLIAFAHSRRGGRLPHGWLQMLRSDSGGRNTRRDGIRSERLGKSLAFVAPYYGEAVDCEVYGSLLLMKLSIFCVCVCMFRGSCSTTG
jgi:hypothetical protein